MTRRLIIASIVLLAILHQDSWWRYDHESLLFKCVPVSLAYHIGISVAASVCWGLACIYCWPKDVDVLDENAKGLRPERGGH